MLLASLDVLCPMHAVLSRRGEIVHVGPTLRKLFSPAVLEGRSFLDLFAVKNPRNVATFADLIGTAGQTLRLVVRDEPSTALQGVIVPGPEQGQSVINLSFGYAVVDAVSRFGLTNADFAATDLTMDMLYLHEAKNMALELSRQSTLRLQDARIIAEERAFTDTLTGLKNRRALDHVMARSVEMDQPFALLQVDLDWFKTVNDTLGHAAGDHVLQVVAHVMMEESRDSDTVARVGGDEFVIVIAKANDPRIVERVGARIIERLVQPIPFEGRQCRISASIGALIRSQGDARSPEELLDDADVALYASKRAGRGQQQFYEPKMRTATIESDDQTERRAASGA